MVKITGKRQITLPAEVCRVLGWHQGDRLIVEVVGDEIRMRRDEDLPVLRPVRPNDIPFLVTGAGHGPADLAENHDKYLAEGETDDGID